MKEDVQHPPLFRDQTKRFIMGSCFVSYYILGAFLKWRNRVLISPPMEKMIRAWWMMAEGGSVLRARHCVPGLCGGCSPHASQLEHGFPGKRTRTAFLPLNRTQPSLTRLFASEWFSRRLIFFRWWISLSWTWTQQRPVSSDWGQCNTKFSPFDFLPSLEF